MPFWMHLSREIQMVALLPVRYPMQLNLYVHSNRSLYTIHSAVNPSLGTGRENIAKEKRDRWNKNSP